MHVKVKLYAMLRQYSDGAQVGAPINVEIPEGASLRDLLSVLGIPAEETRITFVNGIIEELDRPLQEGDDVGMFPAIGGG